MPRRSCTRTLTLWCRTGQCRVQQTQLLVPTQVAADCCTSWADATQVTKKLPLQGSFTATAAGELHRAMHSDHGRTVCNRGLMICTWLDAHAWERGRRRRSTPKVSPTRDACLAVRSLHLRPMKIRLVWTADHSRSSFNAPTNRNDLLELLGTICRPSS